MFSKLIQPFVLLVGASLLATSTLAAPPEGFSPLFNGENLDDFYGKPHFSPIELREMPEAEKLARIAEWTKDAHKHWSVKDGMLVNDGHGAYLVTKKKYRDFEVLIDYKTVARADSGIYLKGTPQVQIWDYTDPGKFHIGSDLGSGGLWNNSPGAAGKDPLVLADKPFGEWNTFRIRQIGTRTTVWLNDLLVVDNAIMENYWDRKSPLDPTGPIELQTHGGEITWRNLYVREFEPEEANQFLMEHEGQAFSSIFNGKDFTGWHGATDQYEVVDGALRCKKGSGGLLLTEKEYANFIARLEFRLPPGGNNGLAIRSPGEGDAAYSAMCELQVLENTHPKYAKLDDRQYHGSAYGMAAAKRGYQRPPGEWNYQQVTVDGSTIKVELNGSLILDTDLSKITEYMADSAHPGKDRKTGFFGFAGHGDPVEFRNIMIKELPTEKK